MRKTTTQVVVFLSILILVVAFGMQAKSRNIEKSSANVQLADEQQALLAEIGDFMLLPKDETPTIATVSDITKLKNQPIFNDARNGDKLLAYPIAKKLILYRPTGKLIIAIAAIHD